MTVKGVLAASRGTTLTRLAVQLCLLAASISLAGCGGGNGGGNARTIPDEPAVVLGQPGAGDSNLYVPVSVGNFWHFTGTASGQFGSSVDNLIAVTGTQLVNGVYTTLVMRESNPNGDGIALQEGVVKDGNGLAVLAGDPADDVLTRELIPYWELRFPLQAGSSFVQLDRTQLDLGQDLDGDGVNETVSVHSEVRVAGSEAVTVPAGTFSDALRIDRSMTLSIRLSRDGRVVPATEVDSTWLVRQLGWVRRTRSLNLEGTSSTADERLDAYQVDVAMGGVQAAATPVVTDSVGAGASAVWVWTAQPAGRYTVTLAGLGGDATLAVLNAPSCIAGSGARAGTLPEDCSFELAGGGPIVVQVRGVAATSYALALAPAPVAIAAPVNESVALTAGHSTVGQVGPRGISSYAVTGLAAGRYTIAISGLDQDADLHVYTDNTYSMELDCTLRAVGDVLPLPEECTASTSGGGLYFRVAAGALNTVGASYLILVTPAP